MISRRSSCSDDPVRTAPSSLDQPSAIGGACKSERSSGVSPLSPLLTRIASATGPGRSLATYGMRGMLMVVVVESKKYPLFKQVERCPRRERAFSCEWSCGILLRSDSDRSLCLDAWPGPVPLFFFFFLLTLYHLSASLPLPRIHRGMHI